MGESYLDARLKLLRRAQNADGGWGYFPGKQSWLEPTAWAALALHGEPEANRAWALLSSWQQRDGSWRPAADVQISSWASALCVTIAVARGELGAPFQRGVEWLIHSAGAESTLMSRAVASVGLVNPERNVNLKGWPWKPGTSSWVEPTAHALVALKRAAPHVVNADLSARVRIGAEQLLDVRCSDGGWNYGSRAARGVALPSYPETTALALVGLQGRADLGKSLHTAARMAKETPSPMAGAWLRIALALHGFKTAAPDGPPPADLAIAAVEALSCANYTLLRTGGEA